MSDPTLKTRALAVVVAAFLTVAVSSVGALQGAGGPVLIRDARGTEVGLYEGSYALVVGISDYTGGWPDLPGVEDDIAAVKAALEKQGFIVTLVTNPTYVDLNSAIQRFISQYGSGKNNRLLFYFAGHGYTVKRAWGEEMGYFVPANAPNPHVDQSGFEETALAMQRVDEYARRIDSNHALFVFDSCFSGSLFAISRSIPENITYKTTRPVRQFITSGSAGEEVPDESVFRKVFINALQGEGDTNRDGFVTGIELGEFLQERVVNYSHGSQHPQYGKIRNPNLDKGDFVFSLNQGPPPQPLPGLSSAVTLFGNLQVNVNVDNTRVFINNVLVGTASRGRPLNQANLPAGRAVVRVEANGYQAVVREVLVPIEAWGQEMFYLPPGGDGVPGVLGGGPVAPNPAAQIESLYIRALEALNKGHITEPSSDNAIAYARTIRQIDPQREEVGRITNEAVSRFIDKAKIALGKNQLSDAQDLVEQAAKITAEFGARAVDVAETRKLIARETSRITAQPPKPEQARRDVLVVGRLLEQADEAIQFNRLTLPKDNSAVDFLRQAQQLAPDDTRIRERLAAVVEAYLELARKDLQQGRPKGAAWFLDKGKGVVAEFSLDPAGIQAMEAQLAELSRRQKQEQEVARLLADAQAAFKDRRLTTTSAGDGVTDSLRAILKLSPNDPQAKDLANQTLRLYGDVGQQQLREGNLNSAEQYLQQATQFAEELGLSKEPLAGFDRAVTTEQERRKQESTIQTLLAQADTALQAGRVDGSGTDNAVAALHAVLKLVPNHPEARSRFARVLDAYAAQGHKALAANDVGGAERLLSKAQALADELRLSPEPLSLAQLNWAIEQKKAKQALSERMEALLAQVDRALTAGQLDQPQGRNALDLLREARKLMPGDGRAQTRIERLIDAYAGRSQRELAHNDPPAARRTLQQAQAIAAEFQVRSPSLATVEEAVRAAEARRADAIAEAQRRQERVRQAQARKQQVTRLLVQADQAVAEGNLVRPKGNNAADLYRKALDLSAGDERVLQLLDELVETIASKGRESLEGGNLEQARAYLGDGQALAQELRLSTAALDRLAKAIEGRAKPSRPQPKVTAAEQEIQTLVEKGEDAVDHNWLTFPKSRSAAQYVRQIFQIVPGHPAGKKLAGSIVDRYLTLTRRYLARENWRKANSYLDRAEGVAKKFGVATDGIRTLRGQAIALAKEQEQEKAETQARAQAERQAAAERQAQAAKRQAEERERKAKANRQEERKRQQLREKFARLILQAERALGKNQLGMARVYLARARRIAGTHKLPTDRLVRLEALLQDRIQAKKRINRLADRSEKTVERQEKKHESPPPTVVPTPQPPRRRFFGTF